MAGFENDIRNIPSPVVNNQPDMFQFIERNKKSKYTIISNMSNRQSDTDNSFLLDSQTYKNIW